MSTRMRSVSASTRSPPPAGSRSRSQSRSRVPSRSRERRIPLSVPSPEEGGVVESLECSFTATSLSSSSSTTAAAASADATTVARINGRDNHRDDRKSKSKSVEDPLANPNEAGNTGPNYQLVTSSTTTTPTTRTGRKSGGRPREKKPPHEQQHDDGDGQQDPQQDEDQRRTEPRRAEVAPPFSSSSADINSKEAPTTTTSTNPPPSDDASSSSSLSRPNRNRNKGSGSRFLSSIKPGWLGKGGKGFGGTVDHGDDDNNSVTSTAADHRRRNRARRSLSVEPVPTGGGPLNGSPPQRRRNSHRPSPSASSEAGDGPSFLDNVHDVSSTAPMTPSRGRRPSAKLSSLGRFGRGRGRSKSPSTGHHLKQEQYPSPEAASSLHLRSNSRARPPASGQRHARQSGSASEESQLHPVDLDDDVSSQESESAVNDTDPAPLALEATLADTIYARAVAAEEQGDAAAASGLGGTTSTELNSAALDGTELNSAALDGRQRVEDPMPSSPETPRIDPVRSLKDLRKRIEYAKSQQWVRDKKAKLAAIRETLGLQHLMVSMPHRRPENAVDAVEATADKRLIDHALPLFRKLVHSIQTKGDESPYVLYVLNSSSCEPEPAIMVFQFLHYLDVLAAEAARGPFRSTKLTDLDSDANPPLQSPEAAEVLKLADEVAKMPTLACWCREILRYPDEFPEPLLECCLGHLQRFPRILDAAERRQHVLCILFRGSKELSALDELRHDLERVVNRTSRSGSGNDESTERFDEKSGFVTLARAVFLYNSVERAVGANRALPKRSGVLKPSSSSIDRMGVFRAALDRHRNHVPESLFKVLEKELLPPCAGPCCFRRGSVRCCASASYCSLPCRDRGWKVHRRACTYGTKIELSFPKEVVVILDEPHRGSPLNGQHADESAQEAADLVGSPQRRFKSDDADEDDESKKALAALKTPKTPKVPLDVIEIFDELRVVPLASQTSSTDWLLKQDNWLRECPEFDYFLARPWGKMGIQFASGKARQEFKDLRKNAPRNVDDVEEMLEVLVRSCPELKASITRQLEREYAMDLSKAAESPTRDSTTSPGLLPNCQRSKEPLITPSPTRKRRVKPSSSPSRTAAGLDPHRSKPWSIVTL